MLDPLGAILVELRDELEDLGITDRVRGFEPAPEDAQPHGSYRRFVVLTRLDVPPDPFLPITDARIGARCYGTSAQDAAALYGALVEALHRKGARVKTSGLGIYMSQITSGGATQKDPDTQQPYETAVIHLIATTQVVVPT